jgi:hypothetical protein
MTMANWFEDVTKTLADEKIGRRTALRRVAGTVAGVALAGAIPGMALAASGCPAGGNCSIGFTNCAGNPNTNCYCFDGVKSKGKGKCGCNQFCSQLPVCTSQAGCSKGTFCSFFTGCNCSGTSGVCITKCVGKNKNCQLGSGHGATVAR